MEKTDNMPIWVYLAFSSITTRKGALLLILSSIVFSLYCIPWSLFFVNHPWVGYVFLIDNWSWVAMMSPLPVWYWISLMWVDRHIGWADTRSESEPTA
tara:strand:+ start:57289 stop:57582 length:294 start_codon:yes stop_codon:yes gene_type:complete